MKTEVSLGARNQSAWGALGRGWQEVTQRWICGLGLEPYHEELVMEHNRMGLGRVKESKF